MITKKKVVRSKKMAKPRARRRSAIGETADNLFAETQKNILRNKIANARNVAYYEQERRTVDPTVKRAVWNALAHASALVLGEPYTPPPLMMGDVVTMAVQIERGTSPKVNWITEAREGKVVAEMAKVVGRYELLIHHYIGYPPEMWFVTCYPFFDRVELKQTDLEEAKKEGLGFLLTYFKTIQDWVEGK